MSAAGAPETWDQWTVRVAAQLGGLADGEWLTITAGSDRTAGGSAPAPGPRGSSPPDAADAPARRRRWSRRRASGGDSAAAREPVVDVFLQARLVGGVLALECIGDTEFEGLSDLSTEQEQALVALGWEQQGREPDFERTYSIQVEQPAGEAGRASQKAAHETMSGSTTEPTTGPTTGATNAAATEAARLLRRSLEQVLGALSPADVVLRRSTSSSSPG